MKDWRANTAFTEAFQNSTASSRIEAKIGAAMLQLAKKEGNEPKWRADMANGRLIDTAILARCKVRMQEVLAIRPETFGALREKGGHGDRYLLAAIDDLTKAGVIERVQVIRGGNKCVGYTLTKSPDDRGCSVGQSTIKKGDPAFPKVETAKATLPSQARRASGGASGNIGGAAK